MKGSPLGCDDYKGILLASHLAEMVLHQFLKPIKPVYDARIPVVQMGAVSKRGTDFGTHMLTSFIETRTHDNDSIGICFVDLVKAFDRALRELVMGWPRSMTSHPIEYLRKAGVGSDDAIWIVNWITKRRPLFEEWRIHPKIAALVKNLHDGCWLAYDDVSTVVLCPRGVRQGCESGPMIFNVHLPAGHGSCQGQTA